MSRKKNFEIRDAIERAMNIFWEQGYEKTSVNDLAKSMKINKKSMYDTFGSKHELFLSSLNFYQNYIQEKINSAINSNNTTEFQIKEIFEISIEQGNKGCLLINSALELASRDNQVKQIIEANFESTEKLFYSLILLGQQKSEISANLDAKKIAKFFLNAWNGIRVSVKAGQPVEYLEEIININLQKLKEV
jgi:Transcriptional regulator